MTANDDWLFEHMVQGYYNTFGVIRETGLTFRSAHLRLPNMDGETTRMQHYFPKPFLPGCRPNIQGTLAASDAVRLVFGTYGLDGSIIADHRGFMLLAHQFKYNANTEFRGEQWWSYLALGY